MINLIPSVEKSNKPFWLVAGLLLLGGVAVGDYITGAELSFSLFYLLPIALISLTVSGTAGICAAFFSAAVWLFLEVMTSTTANSYVYLWNAVIRLGFFLLPALLLKVIEQEKYHARIDFLTGAINRFYFNELMGREIDRSCRYHHPFTIAFMDLDNFKTINDTFGHSFGDDLLRTIAQNMKKNLRKTDAIARVGGDEFVILLPETNSDAAQHAIRNLFHKLAEDLQSKKWPVTFSVGVLTLTAPSISTDKIFSIVDRMMYSVKNNGKNDIKFATYTND